MADTPASIDDAPDSETPSETYTVCRSQDGSLVRCELSFEDATSECAILNAQARQPAGQTVDGIAIYASMYLGEVSRYEVRSASGLVLA